MEFVPPNRRDRCELRAIGPIGVSPGGGPFADGLCPDQLAAVDVGFYSINDQISEVSIEVAYLRARAGSDWYMAPTVLGDYGTRYALRAAIAATGFGADIAQADYYPTAITDSDGELLYEGNRYVIHMRADELPGADLWSITMYGEDNYLLASQDIHAVGPNHSNFVFDSDGGVAIWIQPEDP